MFKKTINATHLIFINTHICLTLEKQTMELFFFNYKIHKMKKNLN